MSNTSGENSTGVGSLDRRLVQIAAVTLLGSMMTIIDSTIVNVAIPTLARDFDTSLATIQWTSTAYLLTLAVVIALTRWVIERIGARNAYLVSLILFLIGSALCGISWSPTSLILFRALQGLGGGMLLPVGQTILTRASGPSRMGRSMAIVAAPALLGVVIGPVLGGFLIDALGWRWIFFINLPIGIAAVIASLAVLEHDRERTRDRFDVVGFVLLPPGLTLLVYGLAELGNAGTATPAALVGLIGGPALVGLFVLHSRRAKSPMLDLRLLLKRAFLTANLAAFIATMGAGSGPFITSLYLQVARGYTPLSSGLFQASLAVGSMITTPLSGRILDRSGPRRLAISGLVITAIAIIPWLFLTPTTSPTLLAASLFLRGIGAGCVFTPLIAAGYSAVSRGEMPNATTISNIGQRVSSAVGVAVIALVLQMVLVANLPGHHVRLGSIPAKGAAFTAIAPGLSRSFAQTCIAYEVFVVVAALVALTLARSKPTKGSSVHLVEVATE